MSEKAKILTPSEQEGTPAPAVEHTVTPDTSPYGPVGGRGILVAAYNEKVAREKASAQRRRDLKSDAAHSAEQSAES